MRATSRSSAVAFLALSASTVQAQFMSYGHNALTRTRMDPILNPGAVAPHTHMFAGTNAINSKMTGASVREGDCTTAPITVDQSGYWIPQLYYKHKDGRYSAISGDGMVTYWFMGRGFDKAKGEKLAVVPDDFRMVGGNMTRDFLDLSIPSHDAVSFQCFGPGYDHRLSYIPADFECETIRPQIYFPSCWNGVDSYKEDNSHVTYPIGKFDGGKCPQGFVPMPALFMETYYKPKQSLGADYEWYPGCFVLANGDNFGLSFHADWINGFPSGLLDQVGEQCPGMTADPMGCPLLAKYKNTKQDCQMHGQIVNEPVGIQTPLAKLPGNNPEYNSSRVANNPKRMSATYTEAASVITLDIAQGGSCKSQKCTDYGGKQGAVQPDMGQPMGPMDPAPAPMEPAPVKLTPAAPVKGAPAEEATPPVFSSAVPMQPKPMAPASSSSSAAAGMRTPNSSMGGTPGATGDEGNARGASQIGAGLNAAGASGKKTKGMCKQKRRLPAGH